MHASRDSEVQLASTIAFDQYAIHGIVVAIAASAITKSQLAATRVRIVRI